MEPVPAPTADQLRLYNQLRALVLADQRFADEPLAWLARDYSMAAIADRRRKLHEALGDEPVDDRSDGMSGDSRSHPFIRLKQAASDLVNDGFPTAKIQSGRAAWAHRLLFVAYLITAADSVWEGVSFSGSEGLPRSWVWMELEAGGLIRDNGCLQGLDSLIRAALTLVGGSQTPADSEPAPASKKRRAKRTPAEIAMDEGKIAAHLADNPEAKRDQIVAATGITAGLVSKSVAWKTCSKLRAEARQANRTRGLGTSED